MIGFAIIARIAIFHSEKLAEFVLILALKVEKSPRMVGRKGADLGIGCVRGAKSITFHSEKSAIVAKKPKAKIESLEMLKMVRYLHVTKVMIEGGKDQGIRSREAAKEVAKAVEVEEGTLSEVKKEIKQEAEKEAENVVENESGGVKAEEERGVGRLILEEITERCLEEVATTQEVMEVLVTIETIQGILAGLENAIMNRFRRDCFVMKFHQDQLQQWFACVDFHTTY